jgi:hypothetical protein
VKDTRAIAGSPPLRRHPSERFAADVLAASKTGAQRGMGPRRRVRRHDRRPIGVTDIDLGNGGIRVVQDVLVRQPTSSPRGSRAGARQRPAPCIVEFLGQRSRLLR